MADRITALDVTNLSVAGTDWKDRLIDLNYGFEIQTEEGKSLQERYGQAVTTKIRNTFSLEMLRGASLSRETSLDVSVYTIGGNANVGTLESGEISVTTKSEDGSGVADKFTFPNSVGTDIEIRGTLFITTTALDVTTAGSGTLANLKVACTVTINANAVVISGLIKSAVHKVTRDGIQRWDVTISLRGSGSLAAAGQTILVDAITGDGIVTYSLATGANTYAGNALITRAAVSWSNGSVIKDRFDFEGQGTPTLS